VSEFFAVEPLAKIAEEIYLYLIILSIQSFKKPIYKYWNILTILIIAVYLFVRNLLANIVIGNALEVF
jgi:hypothetical protein